jgi:hypothetical protein
LLAKPIIGCGDLDTQVVDRVFQDALSNLWVERSQNVSDRFNGFQFGID